MSWYQKVRGGGCTVGGCKHRVDVRAILKLACFLRVMSTWGRLVIVFQQFNHVFQQHSLCHGEFHFICSFDNLTVNSTLSYRSYLFIGTARPTNMSLFPALFLTS